VTQGYLLDTSVLLNLLRGKELGQRIDRSFGLSAAAYIHSISIVSHAELWVLVDRNKWGDDKKTAVGKALKEFVTVDVSGDHIIASYRQVEAASAGRSMGKNDIWIAATAIITGLPLITTDRDFNHLHGKLLDVRYIDPSLPQVSEPSAE